jgi:nitrilase
MRISLLQLASQKDVQENLANARSLIDQAAAEGTDMVVLPEHFALRETDKPRRRAEAEEIPGGRILPSLQEAAQANNIWVHGGSFAEKVLKQDGADDVFYNTTAVINPQGELVATYRKIHLFDYVAPDGTVYSESSMNGSGQKIATYQAGGLTFGCSVCYDLRFPDLYMAMARAGVDVIMVTACFTFNTTRDHWETLMRARAIDTQCYMVGVNQFGTFPDGSRPTGGRSMIVDPWGVATTMAPEQVGVTTGLVSAQRIKDVRVRFSTAQDVRDFSAA